jgi:stage II sporulation protein D
MGTVDLGRKPLIAAEGAPGRMGRGTNGARRVGGGGLEGWSTAALAAVVLVGGATTATADVAPTGEGFARPDDGVYELAGHGFGHGRGMSQWGAHEAAENGHGYKKILDFYYPDTRLVDDAVPKTIRVRLSHDNSDVRVRMERNLEVVWTDASGDVSSQQLPSRLAGCKVGTWRVKAVRGKDLTLEGYSCSEWRTLIAPDDVDAAGRISFVTADDTFAMERRPSGRFVRRLYRGDLRVVLRDKALRPINIVKYDDYLRSVVPSESPAGWPVDALRAQAVAARTYAMRSAVNRKNRYFDVYDTTASQVYPGIASLKLSWEISRRYEKERTDEAVRDTGDETLVFDDKPALTEFGSSNGGWTASGGVPYLKALEDGWDPGRDWTDTVKVATLERRYPSIGSLRELRIVERSGGGEWGGRVRSVELVGSKGERTINGEDKVRNALGLRSAWFTVTS